MREDIEYIVVATGNKHSEKRTVAVARPHHDAHHHSALHRIAHLVGDHAVSAIVDEGTKAAVQAALPMASIYLANPVVGLAASLLLASRSRDPGVSLAILTAEHPGMRKETLDMVERAFKGSDKDVAYPTAGGKPGYPVVISPEGREAIERFDPASDDLHGSARQQGLSELPVECRDVGIYQDLEAERDLTRDLARERQDFSLDRSES